ncbi:adenosylmethionine decarboxylase [Amycolatopsis kentuckyensis]|uniref:adenosylmethionine decarboxylase n=1 Tax=Amycolatopsis kentuckyensis TaxID=218823 RepID=UPI000A366F92|nr:adenosylmethionine decarboxylase [Amycolatopsis kentuckyensis]
MPDVGRFTGRHVLAELHGIDSGLLDDPVRLGELLRAAVTEAGATVLDVVAQRFAPQGATVIALLAESHASVHTYPEHGSLFADVFTCGERADPEHALRLLAQSLDAAPVHLSVLHRGER